jgi:hypothetical protein
VIPPFSRANVAVAATLAGFALLLWVVAPVGALDCREPRWSSTSPDGASLRLCPRRVGAFAMPGQGGDAPGFLVLRDAAGWVRGVASIEMVQTLQREQARWERGTVHIPLHAELPHPAWRPAPIAFLVEAQWRVRAYLGLIPSDRDFR